MATRYRGDPEFWRKRAAESRAIAELLADGEAKASMVKIAEEYDRLAERLDGGRDQPQLRRSELDR